MLSNLSNLRNLMSAKTVPGPVDAPVDVPDVQWLAECDNISHYSPDIASLERQASQLLFVYDNMMVGRPEYHRLKDTSEFKVTGFTVDHYSMWRKEDRAIALLPDDPLNVTEWEDTTKFINKFKHHAVIKGQILAVKSQTFIELDRYMENKVQFERVKVQVDAPMRDVIYFGEKGIETINRRVRRYLPYMYIGRKAYWDQRLDHGYEFNPVTIFKPVKSLNKSYYFFTTL